MTTATTPRERPKRIQRKRTKGWRMPEGAVYVGRPTLFGNPFFGPGAMPSYRAWLERRNQTAFAVFEELKDLYPKMSLIGNEMLTGNGVLALVYNLRGKDLCCWCPLTEQCHANILLMLADQEAHP